MDIRGFDAMTKALAGDASRRTVVRRLVGGALATLLAGRDAAPALAGCKGNSRRCDLPTDCCSGRCEGGRCRRGRLRPGEACERDQECRSRTCGRINNLSSICRSRDCVRTGRRCRFTTDCCRGLCSNSTFKCTD